MPSREAVTEADILADREEQTSLMEPLLAFFRTRRSHSPRTCAHCKAIGCTRSVASLDIELRRAPEIGLAAQIRDPPSSPAAPVWKYTLRT
jgi:hypothetical protein